MIVSVFNCERSCLLGLAELRTRLLVTANQGETYGTGWVCETMNLAKLVGTCTTYKTGERRVEGLAGDLACVQLRHCFVERSDFFDGQLHCCIDNHPRWIFCGVGPFDVTVTDHELAEDACEDFVQNILLRTSLMSCRQPDQE